MKLSEKYRPQNVDECVGLAAQKIRKLLDEDERLPHILLYGPPGTGKTTLAHCIVNERLGDFRKSDFIEVNASAERGIDMIRNKIVRYTKLKSMSGKQKVVLLDEADSITKVAFEALRRPLETVLDSCCLIFTANDVSKVHDAIRSRCIEIEVTLSDKFVMERFREISEVEGFEQEADVIERLIKVWGYDLRKLLDMYEMYRITGELGQPDFMPAWAKIEVSDWKGATKMLKPEMLSPMFEYLCRIMDPMMLMKITPVFALYDWRLSAFSVNPQIQLQAFAVEMVEVMK